MPKIGCLVEHSYIGEVLIQTWLKFYIDIIVIQYKFKKL